MNHLFKRSLSMIIAVVMVLAMIPASPVHVHAANPEGFSMKFQSTSSTSESINGEWTFYDSLAGMGLYVRNTSSNSYNWRIQATLGKVDGDTITPLVSNHILYNKAVPTKMPEYVNILSDSLSALNNKVTTTGNGRYALQIDILDNNNNGERVGRQTYYFNYTDKSVILDLVKTNGDEGLVLQPDEE